MKRLLLPLLAALALPTAVNSEPIPKISDWDASISYPYRLDFSCPKKIVKIREGVKIVKKKIPIYEQCWVDFHQDYMDIMGMQTIKKEEIVKYWFQKEGFVGIRFYFHFLYRDPEGNLLKFIPMREAGLNGARDVREYNHDENGKWKVSLYMNAHNFINNWLAQ